MRHAVPLDKGPHPRRVGEIRGPVVQDDCRAEHEPARDEPRTHHPADIRRPEDHVALLKVEAVREILRGFYWKPAVHVLRALRFAGRARGVDDHEWVLGGGVGDVEHRPGMRDVRPGNVAAALGKRPAHAIDDDHGAYGWCAVRRLVRDLLHLHDLPASIEAIGADEDRRLGIAQPAGDGLRAVSREDRDEDSADRADREDRHRALHGQWKEDRDAVAMLHPKGAQPGGEARDLVRELAVCERADGALLALRDDRDTIAVVSQGRRDVVHPAARPPGRPRKAA